MTRLITLLQVGHPKIIVGGLLVEGGLVVWGWFGFVVVGNLDNPKFRALAKILAFCSMVGWPEKQEDEGIQDVNF